jgi:hypothetical protein
MTKRWRRGRRRLWQAGAWALVPLAAASGARAQVPVPPSGPAAAVLPRYGYYGGPQTFHDTFIGRPELFYEPPPGFYINEQFALMHAKADPHRFTLYQSDFLPGTTRPSPTGATRFNLMAKRLPQWLGPVIVEWSPDQPGLAEARRAAVLETLQKGGVAMIPERVVIGPSPYPGTLGADAVNYYNNMITRDRDAAPGMNLTPMTNTVTFGAFGAAGGGGGR